MDLQVRTVEPRDLAAVASLLDQLGYPQDTARLADRIGTFADTAADAVLVAEIGDQVVGVATVHVTTFLHEEGAGRARLTALVVDAERRSGGIGAELLRAAEEAARKRGCTALELTSSAHREAAHRFYVNAGYEVVPHRFMKHLEA